MDEIKTNLKVNYPEFPLPQDDILYSTIGTLIQDKKLMLKNGGYMTLPCEQAKHVKTQFVTKDHKLHSNEQKSIFSRLFNGIRRRAENPQQQEQEHQHIDLQPFAFNAPLMASPSLAINKAQIVTRDYGLIDEIDMRQYKQRSSRFNNQHQSERRSTRRPHSINYYNSQKQNRQYLTRSFSFEEELSVIHDNDDDTDNPSTITSSTPRRMLQIQNNPSYQRHRERRSNSPSVSNTRRSQSIKHRPYHRRQRTRSKSHTNRSQQQMQPINEHNWTLCSNNNHSPQSSSITDTSSSDEIKQKTTAFSPRSTSTVNVPRNRKPIMNATNFSQRLSDLGKIQVKDDRRYLGND
ncbi:unnamed protein product, partial [Didymodactylos carnosus]